MKNKIFYGILALVIGMSAVLSSCAKDSEKVSEDGSSVDVSITAEDISTGEVTSEEASEATSEVASGETSEETSEEVSEEVSEEISEEINLADIFKTPEGFKGHMMGDALTQIDVEKGFSVSFSIPDMGVDKITVYLKDKSLSMEMEMSLMGQKMNQRVIFNNGKAYMLDSKNKKYTVEKVSFDEVFGDISLDSADEAQFIERKEETINGITYVVESYKGQSDEGEDIVDYYFNNGNLEMAKFQGVMLIFSITNEVPEGVFDIPEGYTELMPGDIIAVPEEYKDLAIGKALSKFNGTDGFVISTVETETFEGEPGGMDTTTTVYVKGKNVRIDDETESYYELGPGTGRLWSNSEIYVNGIIYYTDNIARTYSISYGDFMESTTGIFDMVKYKKTVTEKIDGKKYTVDVFTYSLDDMFGFDDSGNGMLEMEDIDVKFYTLNGEVKYVEADGSRISFSITPLEETEGLFEVPSDYTLKEYEDDFGFDGDFDYDYDLDDDFGEDSDIKI